MKVVYETLEHQLRRVITEADANGRRILYIELNPSEWREMQTWYSRYPETNGVAGGSYMGVELRKQP
jgi:hypothetical protein